MEEERICTHCGKVLAKYEGAVVDGELLCDECLDDYCITCDCCGETIWTEDCVTDDNTYLCQECFNNHYNRCESCGRIIHNDCTCWHNDLPYCEGCFDDFEDEIEDYSYKPDPIFYGDSYLYFGVELEVDKGSKDGENQAEQEEVISRILFFIEKNWNKIFRFSRRNEYNMNR